MGTASNWLFQRLGNPSDGRVSLPAASPEGWTWRLCGLRAPVAVGRGSPRSARAPVEDAAEACVRGRRVSAGVPAQHQHQRHREFVPKASVRAVVRSSGAGPETRGKSPPGDRSALMSEEPPHVLWKLQETRVVSSSSLLNSPSAKCLKNETGSPKVTVNYAFSKVI